MLKFLAPRQPPRTPIAHLSNITFDNGQSSIHFRPPTALNSSRQLPRENNFQPSEGYLVRNRLPPCPKHPQSSSAPNSALCPPVHFHRTQSETFHVVHGKAKFFLDRADLETAVCREAVSEEIVVIPACTFHTFRNASSEDDLVIEFRLDPPSISSDNSISQEERFFRNTQTYRDDCRKANLPRSMAQVLLFNYHAGVVLALPGPQFLAKPLGVLLNYFGGVVLGQYLFGFRETYPEYCVDRLGDAEGTMETDKGK